MRRDTADACLHLVGHRQFRMCQDDPRLALAICLGLAAHRINGKGECADRQRVHLPERRRLTASLVIEGDRVLQAATIEPDSSVPVFSSVRAST